MIVNSLKALLFVAGGTVVAAGAAYITGALDVFFPEKPQLVAAPQPESVGAQQPPAMAVGKLGDAKPAGEQMAALPAGNAASPADPATSGKEDRLVVPTFDLVRVEPDGSVVIAGQAAPNAKVEVVTGSSVIGTDKAGAGGDFAVVLNDPLKPGDYTIVLRSTTPDNVVATSEETAVVSVPQNQSGQVLALVEKPGAPSKLITVPQVESAAAKQDRPAASGEAAAGAQEPRPEQPASEAAPAQPGGQMAALPADKPEPAATDKPEPAATEKTEPAANEKPAEQAAAGNPAAASGAPQQAPAMAAQQTGAQDQAGQAAPAAQAADAAPPSGQQIAAAQPEQSKPAPVAEKPRISVEAVEIEGSRVFVAGRTEPNGRVRVYANEILLGDAKASPGGQFLVEAQRELPVGDYIVRADLLGPRAEVLARAAVPFEREPGESIAAVAAAEPAAQEPQAAAPQPQAEAQGTEAGASAGSQIAAAGAPAQTGNAGSAGDAASAAAPAGQAAASSSPAQDGQQAAAASPAGTTAEPAQDASALAAGGDAAVASADGSQDVTAPKLKSVAGAVIIRRGDTLWRISRRVYGLGVRYTTIYLANQDQISDPDRIWPGQVFSVPDKTGDGEQADMSAVADRVVPVE